MENTNHNSWLDIKANIQELIIRDRLADGDELPSVRAVVNEWRAHHTTVRKAYDALAAEGIIMKRSGQRPIVAKDAAEKIRLSQRREFLELELPKLLMRMKELDLAWADLPALASYADSR